MHRALGDEVRLRIVDELLLADRTPAELGEIVGIASNLMAHHLGVLEDNGLLVRRSSEGDRRRKYVSLDDGVVRGLVPVEPIRASSVVFVCTHNSARSQFAEAMLKTRVDLPVQSAGTTPADVIHPMARSAASELGVELTGSVPRAYAEVSGTPDLVVSVCDKAREAPTPFRGRSLHWSIPDPVTIGRPDAFMTAFSAIASRVDRLVDAIEGGRT
jgi:protein-tyrosine-phosphatase